ncbi:general substrate transporter [Thozetella sp. PMI_491]|nr:general substrate transporter [Thozetella sp. PMI_491]
MGALMFGYDLGFIGTAMVLPSFVRDFDLTHASSEETDAIHANVVSLLVAGCILGSLIAGPFSDRFGRIKNLLLLSILFVVGSAIQTGSRGSYVAMLVGRAIGGIGVGMASMVVPIYVAELSPPAIRGRLIGIYEIFVSGGTLIGFWINYGLAQNVPNTSSAQWEVSFGVQLIPGGLLVLGLVWMPESPRWLARHADREACLSVLSKLRKLPADHPYIIEESTAIFNQIAYEESLVGPTGFVPTLREMAEPSNRRRLVIGVFLFVFMQMAGSNAINYYSPTIFKSIGVTGTSTGLFATGIYGLVRFIATMISMLWVVDRFGRTRMLMGGGAIMAFALWFIGVYVKVASPGAGSVDAGGYASIVMIYVYAVGWCFSFGGVPWIIAAEIFPLRIRGACISVCVATHWIMNFMIARASPYMLANITYGTYFLFAACTTLSVPWVYFFVPETKNVSLEDMDRLFGVEVFAEETDVEKAAVTQLEEVPHV